MWPPPPTFLENPLHSYPFQHSSPRPPTRPPGKVESSGDASDFLWPAMGCPTGVLAKPVDRAEPPHLLSSSWMQFQHRLSLSLSLLFLLFLLLLLLLLLLPLGEEAPLSLSLSLYFCLRT